MRDGRGKNGRNAERADRRLLWVTIKPSMPLAFDNYSRSVLHMIKNERIVTHIRTHARTHTRTHAHARARTHAHTLTRTRF